MRGGGGGNRDLGVSGLVLSCHWGSGRLWVSKSREECVVATHEGRNVRRMPYADLK